MQFLSGASRPACRVIACLLLCLFAGVAGPNIVLHAQEAAVETLEAGQATPSLGTSSAVESATRNVSYGPAVWLRIPSIEVDSAVVEVGITDGYYDASWWDVGHHVDSANPGEPGNSIFNGHVETIGYGRVFRRLHELTPGDLVYVYTDTHRIDWVVTEIFSVPSGDNGFLYDTASPRLTLYTCTGVFNLLEREFSDRLVVAAELVQAVAMP